MVDPIVENQPETVASVLSLVAQILSIGIAVLVGRYKLRSAPAIALVSMVGAFGAMAANIAVDGQCAFLYIAFAPIIYIAAVAGRREFRSRS